jgi:hypothetical protein
VRDFPEVASAGPIPVPRLHPAGGPVP